MEEKKRLINFFWIVLKGRTAVIPISLSVDLKGFIYKENVI